MSIRHSLLAILDQGPCYGYQLGVEFERRTGATWPLNVGQIYSTLDRLERDGLVSKAEASEQGHIYYSITTAGHEAVSDWLGTPVVRSTTSRDELAIKLALAVTLPGVDFAHVVQVQRAASLRALQDLTRAKNATDSPDSVEELAGVLVLDSLIFQAEADVRWLDHTESRLARAAESGALAPLPLSTETPKRGRPARRSDATSAEARR